MQIVFQNKNLATASFVDADGGVHQVSVRMKETEYLGGEYIWRHARVYVDEQCYRKGDNAKDLFLAVVAEKTAEGWIETHGEKQFCRSHPYRWENRLLTEEDRDELADHIGWVYDSEFAGKRGPQGRRMAFKDWVEQAEEGDTYKITRGLYSTEVTCRGTARC